jgi:cell division protein FtsB
MTTYYSNDTTMQMLQIMQQRIEALQAENDALRASNDLLQGQIYMERIKKHEECTNLIEHQIKTLDFINSKLNMNG